MRKKELQNFKNKPVADIDKELSVYREQLSDLKLDLSLGKVKSIKEIRTIKKNIAQLLTLRKLVQTLK